jgi:hypothetical protein
MPYKIAGIGRNESLCGAGLTWVDLLTNLANSPSSEFFTLLLENYIFLRSAQNNSRWERILPFLAST